ncbi:MAG: hypothetical protein CL723_03540 [Chloroflexi bacterium]|nr:hypothetical protein [Chloroflexota bacterium]
MNTISKSNQPLFGFLTSDFLRLCLAISIFAAGTWQEHVSIGYIVYEMTDSEFLLALAFAVRFLPFLVVSNYIGYISDLVSRRTLLIILMIIGSVALFVMSFFITSSFINYYMILFYIFVSGSVWSSSMLTQQSYSYDLTGYKYSVKGIAITKGADRIGGMFGGLLSGILVMRNYRFPFIVSGFLQCIAALILIPNSKISLYSPKNKTKPKLTEVISILKKNKILLTVVILSCGTEIFGFSHNSLIPVFVKDVLGGDGQDLGLMMSFRQIGGIIGLLSIVVFGSYIKKGLWLLFVILGFGISLFLLGFQNHYVYFVLISLFVNVFASSCDSLYQIITQRSVDNKDRGKAMGAWLFTIGSGPLGYLIIGLLSNFISNNINNFSSMYNSIGPQMTINITGIILIIISLTFLKYAKELKEVPA